MATTEQRNGFRLPWAPDARPGVPAKDQTPPAPEPPPDAEGVSTPDPTTAEATEMQDVTTPDPRAVAWPDADSQRDDEAPPDPAEGSAPAAEPSPPRPRRENLLVTGLVRAMRDAALAARQETTARFADEAKARVESIHAQAADETAELRTQAEAEIVEIRDWSKAEMARIREETDKRISDRKAHLETEIERHAALVGHRVERVEAATADFERQMESFFEHLLAEEDPARLAGLAEQLPEAPSLDLDDLDRAAPTFAPETFAPATLDASGAAAAEAEAFADLEAVDDDSQQLPEDEANVFPEDDVARRLDAFTIHATAPESVASQLAVTGLVSVASIAGFKRALARTQGIRSVTVASGPSGEFVFTVNHDPETDLRSTVPALEGFAAQITGDTDGVLQVSATDPESAH